MTKKKQTRWSAEILTVKYSLKKYQKKYKALPEIMILHRAGGRVICEGWLTEKELKEYKKNGDITGRLLTAYKKWESE